MAESWEQFIDQQDKFQRYKSCASLKKCLAHNQHKWNYFWSGKNGTTSSHLIYPIQFVRNLSLSPASDFLVLLVENQHSFAPWEAVVSGRFWQCSCRNIPTTEWRTKICWAFPAWASCAAGGWLSAQVWGQPGTTFLSLAFCLWFPEFFMLIYMFLNAVTRRAKGLLLLAV